MMDIWELDISFYTDGDFGWDFAPIDMRCDHYQESYSLHIYREINENQTESCVKDEFYSILDFLIDNIHGKDYAVEYVKNLSMMLSVMLESAIIIKNYLEIMMDRILILKFIHQRISAPLKSNVRLMNLKRFKTGILEIVMRW